MVECRHAVFKRQCPKGCAGASPAIGTFKFEKEFIMTNKKRKRKEKYVTIEYPGIVDAGSLRPREEKIHEHNSRKEAENFVKHCKRIANQFSLGGGGDANIEIMSKREYNKRYKK